MKGKKELPKDAEKERKSGSLCLRSHHKVEVSWDGFAPEGKSQSWNTSVPGGWLHHQQKPFLHTESGNEASAGWGEHGRIHRRESIKQVNPLTVCMNSHKPYPNP